MTNEIVDVSKETWSNILLQLDHPMQLIAIIKVHINIRTFIKIVIKAR
jgi:hypothetical protein